MVGGDERVLRRGLEIFCQNSKTSQGRLSKHRRRDPENKVVHPTCFECILSVSTNLPGQYIVQVFLKENSGRG